MATNKSGTPNSLNKRKRGDEDIISDEDRINNLPDAVVQHILSFLPTKQAVATSVLSLKWNNMWNSVPVLRLKFCSSSTKPLRIQRDDHLNFVKFVDRVLQLHHASNVRKFLLIYKPPDCLAIDLFRLNSWITTAISKCKVEELDLVVFNSEYNPFSLPRCLLLPESLKTLTRLKIDISSSLKLPAYIQFAKLKVLRLCNVTLSSASFAEQVHLDFPALEEIHIDAFQLNFKTLSILAPELKTLGMSPKTDVELCYEILVYSVTLESFRVQSGLFSRIFTYNYIDNEDGGTPTIMPLYLRHHIKSFEISNYNGNPDELNFMSDLLMNSTVLEKMIIFVSRNFWADPIKYYTVCRELLSIPRGSTRCTVHI